MRDARRSCAVKDPSHVQNLSAREPGDPLAIRAGNADRIEKARGHKSMMNGKGKSDGSMVPTKRPNKPATAGAEDVEGRDLTEGNTDEQNADRTQNRIKAAPSALDRVRERARRDKDAKFTALLHHVTVERLGDAYRRPRSTANNSRITSSRCTHGCTEERTERSRHGERTSPRPTVDNDRSASRRWRTNSSSARWSR